MKSKQALVWGIVLSLIGILGILYNFAFGFDFSSRILSFLAGFVCGVCLGFGVVLVIFNLCSKK
jgi:hydrogenase/urease accessory protein HupE